jgi:hypothetical protein
MTSYQPFTTYKPLIIIKKMVTALIADNYGRTRTMSYDALVKPECDKAFKTLCQHLQKQHTPDIMATLLYDSMHNWTNHTYITLPTWPIPTGPIMESLTMVFASQRQIGWDQFFRGCLASDWKSAIHLYYNEQQPGASFTPDQWMRTTINAIWKFTMPLWFQHTNASYRGENSA